MIGTRLPPEPSAQTRLWFISIWLLSETRTGFNGRTARRQWQEQWSPSTTRHPPVTATTSVFARSCRLSKRTTSKRSARSHDGKTFESTRSHFPFSLTSSLYDEICFSCLGELLRCGQCDRGGELPSRHTAEHMGRKRGGRFQHPGLCR